jgi:hypothetical protein
VDPVLRLETAQLAVEPGGQAVAVVTVLNPGTIVESYTLDVVGEQPIPWAEVTPPVLSVYPQQQETATIVFSPPSGPDAPGGTVAFGIRAKSQVDPLNSAVVEGQLEIGQVFGLQAKLTPVTSSGRWRGLHTIQFSNWGNSPARLRIVASDPDQALGFLVRPEVIDVPLGATVTARLKVRTRKPVLRGSPTRLPFKVVGEPDPPRPAGGPDVPGIDPARPSVDGALTQKPILSRGTVMAATVVAAALVGLLVFALTRGPGVAVARGDGTTTPLTPELRAAALNFNTVELSWKPLGNIDSYGLQRINPATKGVEGVERGIDGLQESKKIEKLAAETEYCFKLFGVNGEVLGPPSERVCVKTPKAPPPPPTSLPTSGPSSGPSDPGGSTTPTPTDPASTTPSQTTGSATTPGGSTDPFVPADWIALIDVVTAQSPAAQQSVNDKLAKLKGAGVVAGIVRTTGQFPGLVVSQKLLNDHWVVYVGPASSLGAARDICQSEKVQSLGISGAACVAVQPAKAPGG